MQSIKKITMALLTVCFMAAGALGWTQNAYAAKINSSDEAKKIALDKVPNATVTDIDRSHENGVLVYEVELVKGNLKYDITYRASNAKIIEYGWEKISVKPNSSKALISKSKCRRLAKKKVEGGTIRSITKKYDDGIDLYKVKMYTKNKSYTLKFHARTGALIDYEWKLKTVVSTSANTENGFIGLDKAKQTALNQVPGAAVVKAEFDTDDGVPVYEIELVKGNYEYEFKIDAKTGTILEQEKDWND